MSGSTARFLFDTVVASSPIILLSLTAVLPVYTRVRFRTAHLEQRSPGSMRIARPLAMLVSTARPKSTMPIEI